jgi:hypothetical protein
MVGAYNFSFPSNKLFLKFGEPLDCHIPERIRVPWAQSWRRGRLSNIS